MMTFLHSKPHQHVLPPFGVALFNGTCDDYSDAVKPKAAAVSSAMDEAVMLARLTGKRGFAHGH